VPGGEDKPRFDPGRASAGTVGILLSPADLERGDAQTGQGQGCFRCLGLDLTTKELASDPLELLADVQLGGVQVDELPGEPEYLAPCGVQGPIDGGVQQQVQQP